MKIEKEFAPITITIENKDELKDFKKMLLNAYNYHNDKSYSFNFHICREKDKDQSVFVNYLMEVLGK